MTVRNTITEWDLRSEILEVSHRWPQVFIAFLLGCLLGWGAAFLFPSPHRAETELYVAYNGDAIFRNADDYKNWQLGELEAYIVSNDVLGETLHRLQQLDPYWKDVSNAGLRPHLNTYWRNAGRWRLVAEWRGKERAEQLSQVWTQVILENTRQAAVHAAQVLTLGNQLDAASRSSLDLKLSTVQLTQVRAALQTWRDAYGSASSAPIDTLSRWRLQFLVGSVAGLLPAELDLSTQLPPPEASVTDYLPVVDQAITSLDGQLAILQTQAKDLNDQQAALTSQWKEESAASHNLTSNLQVESLSGKESAALPVRPISQMAVVGGVLGVLVWGLIWLGRPLRKARR
jgi:hypothetical protein